MYYENYILISIEIPNYEEIKKKYFDNEGNKIVLLNDNYSIQSPFEYFTPVMYSDGSGHIPILAFLIGVGIGALVGTGMSIYKDYKDDNSINGSIGAWAYVGSIIGGAIAGAGQGFASTILLGMAGSITNSVVGSGFNPDWGNMVVDCLFSVIFSSVGYGFGQMIRYGAAGVEATALKLIARKVGNGSINKLLVKIGAGVNIGMKNTKKIADGLFKAEKDLVGVAIESLGSSIPDSIFNIFKI